MGTPPGQRETAGIASRTMRLVWHVCFCAEPRYLAQRLTRAHYLELLMRVAGIAVGSWEPASQAASSSLFLRS